MLVLLILSRSSLPYNRISVSWSIIKIINIANNTIDCVQEGLPFMLIVWTVRKVMTCSFNIFATIACRIKSVLKTVLKIVFTKVT